MVMLHLGPPGAPAHRRARGCTRERRDGCHCSVRGVSFPAEMLLNNLEGVEGLRLRGGAPWGRRWALPEARGEESSRDNGIISEPQPFPRGSLYPLSTRTLTDPVSQEGTLLDIYVWVFPLNYISSAGKTPSPALLGPVAANGATGKRAPSNRSCLPRGEAAPPSYWEARRWTRKQRFRVRLPRRGAAPRCAPLCGAAGCAASGSRSAAGPKGRCGQCRRSPSPPRTHSSSPTLRVYYSSDEALLLLPVLPFWNTYLKPLKLGLGRELQIFLYPKQDSCQGWELVSIV